MPNFARPVADIDRGSWVTHSGATVNLWATIDDDPADDADFVVSAIGNNSSAEFRLSSVPPAVIPRAHSIILRGRKDAANGNTKGVTVTLLQGVTVIGTQDFPALPANVVQETITMPRAMAAQITDYSDLRIRFTPTGITSGGSARRRVIITGIALRVPAAVDLVDDLLTRWGITVDAQNGTWQVSRSGFVGTGPTLAYAIHDLYRVMREADWQNAEVERRWNIAYYLWKTIEYERLRSEIVADPNHPDLGWRTQAEGIARIDYKLGNILAVVRTADSQETG